MTIREERVVLLDDNLEACGTMDKALVHTADTPLHLAFSCYIFNAKNELLVTRRALSKKAWPGIWTNSVCGHPMPDESIDDAVKRRCLYEMGLVINTVDLIDRQFSYRATDASGIVENEHCPVFLGYTTDMPKANAQEVMDYFWAPIDKIIAGVAAVPEVFSPWMVAQLARPVIRSAIANLARF
ncbi:Isopentenyl-diphosphate Delta-isomerase [Budvicia aquatica]|uniref:Isopentenyl-diphosphate Delta-isomerase n=1 Tax=Budvicia aquatica TaxID=82979 RepID=A0A484ZM60_9GAMM|nr:Isopentenyl-diphosphate Delta-isomerase [Budvicia aquatica]